MRYPQREGVQRTFRFEPPVRIGLPYGARQAVMSKVAMLTTAHLERATYVYVRQSSETQVQTHVERQRLQYALSDRARDLGFRGIEVIDQDLGASGTGVHRPDFDALGCGESDSCGLTEGRGHRNPGCRNRECPGSSCQV